MLVDQESSSVKVIDFGLAELFNPSQKFADFIGGTRLYMAPEVFRQQMTVKTDIWSVGDSSEKGGVHRISKDLDGF